MSKLCERSRKPDAFIPAADDDMIICRCEEITKGEIRRAVYDGMRNVTEVRRFLRAGMGLCQGQTCGRLVQGIIARELGVRPAEVEPAPSRAPMRPVEMYILGDEKKGGVSDD